MEIVADFILLGSKITADSDCSYEIKMLAPWKKSYDQPRQYIKKLFKNPWLFHFNVWQNPLQKKKIIIITTTAKKESSPAPQFKSINSSMLSLFYGPTLTSIHDYWKNHSFECADLCRQSNVSAFNILSRLVIALRLFSADFVVGSLMNALSSSSWKVYAGGKADLGRGYNQRGPYLGPNTESDEKSGRRMSACPVKGCMQLDIFPAVLIWASLNARDKKKETLEKIMGQCLVFTWYRQLSLPPWISGFIILIKIRIFSFFFKNHSALLRSFKYSHVRPLKMVLTFNDTRH